MALTGMSLSTRFTDGSSWREQPFYRKLYELFLRDGFYVTVGKYLVTARTVRTRMNYAQLAAIIITERDNNSINSQKEENPLVYRRYLLWLISIDYIIT